MKKIQLVLLSLMAAITGFMSAAGISQGLDLVLSSPPKEDEALGGLYLIIGTFFFFGCALLVVLVNKLYKKAFQKGN